LFNTVGSLYWYTTIGMVSILYDSPA
jgi:hypothetical protein